MTRPGIRPDLCRASRQLHLAMASAPKKKPAAPLGQKSPNGLRARFYAWLRSRAARWIKAGL